MFDTSILDKARRIQQEERERQRIVLLHRVEARLRAVREKYGLREAYICGSLLSARQWHRYSDVDVAVGGCSGAALEVMRELEEVTGKEVDVVDLDRHPCPEAFRSKGVKVYG